MEELDALFDANADIAAAVSAAYQTLLSGVPTVAGYKALIKAAVDTNFGSNNPAIDFNRENIFINIFSSLATGNGAAAEAFEDITLNGNLSVSVERLYKAFVREGDRSDAGLAYLSRPEALAFYQQVAIDRGVPGPDGAAIAAAASLLSILVNSDLAGIGSTVNDLLAAVNNGTAQIPAGGVSLTQIDTASASGRPGEIFSLPDEIPSVRDTLSILGFRDTGAQLDKLDFSAFVGAESVLKLTAGGAIGDHNVIIAAPGSGIHGGIATASRAIFDLDPSGDAVFIVDDDGIAGGSAEVYYYQESGFSPSVGFVGTLIGVATEDLTASNIA